jgi:hypothetical protein
MATVSFKAAKAGATAKTVGTPAKAAQAPTPAKGGFVVEDKGGDRIPTLEAGVYQAVAIGLFDVGTDTGGTFGPKRKMVLVWEIPAVTIDVERDGETVTLPRNISQRYTMSLNEKARLRQDVEAIRCKRLTKDEARAFDVSCILGANAQIQVTNVEKDGKTFANVETVMACPKGMAALTPTVEPVMFHFGAVDFGAEPATEALIPETCPRWVKKLIMASPEWAERGGKPMAENE